jgi:hypothetical protein
MNPGQASAGVLITNRWSIDSIEPNPRIRVFREPIDAFHVQEADDSGWPNIISEPPAHPAPRKPTSDRESMWILDSRE